MANHDNLRNVIVLAMFKERTRAAAAKQEAAAILELLGVHHAIVDIMGGMATTRVVRIRLRTPEDAQAAVARIRTRSIHSDLTTANVWIQWARTPAEAARTGPGSRAIRTLNVHLETERVQGGRPTWQVEGECQPGRELYMCRGPNSDTSTAYWLGKATDLGRWATRCTSA